MLWFDEFFNFFFAKFHKYGKKFKEGVKLPQNVNIVVNLGVFILRNGKIVHHNKTCFYLVRAILFQNLVQQNSFQNR